MDKYFTFLYVKSGNSGVKTLRIHRYIVYAAATLIVGLIVTAVSLVARYSGKAETLRKVTALERENSNLIAKIEGFQKEIGELKSRMALNYELQNQVRLLAGIDPISREVWEVGVGGPEPLDRMELHGNDIILANLDKSLEQMVRQSELELKSYKEVMAMLEKDKKIRDCTPTIRPLRGGFLSSRFGRRMDPFTGRLARHLGVDFCARTGTPVMATANGIVTMAKRNGSFGLFIEINHGNGFKTRYGHLSKILVRRGQRVKRREIIGLVGNTGRSTGSHLHYEVIYRRVHRNPLNYIIPAGVYYD
ncbi:MAG: hypothetical protein B6D63_00035 [Candidatus Latescibacteria bacterium 4484_7]|nr:MAG: hypothetical protein B6D63_00035 [Candidatus Latescibacteria bacterium 4484_7]